MPNQECAKLRAASIECSYSNRRQREHILGASDYHRIVGIRKRDADYPHLLIPTSHGVFTTPDSKSQWRPPGRLPSGSGYPQSRGNDGNALVSVDLAEINHASLPARLPASHQAVMLPRVHSRALNRL